MFDIGFFELMVIGVIGLVVLGPERLPHAVRMTSAWIGKIRRATISVRTELEREINTHEMKRRIEEEIKKSGLNDLKSDLKGSLEHDQQSKPSATNSSNDNSIGNSSDQQRSHSTETLDTGAIGINSGDNQPNELTPEDLDFEDVHPEDFDPDDIDPATFLPKKRSTDTSTSLQSSSPSSAP